MRTLLVVAGVLGAGAIHATFVGGTLYACAALDAATGATELAGGAGHIGTGVRLASSARAVLTCGTSIGVTVVGATSTLIADKALWACRGAGVVVTRSVGTVL